jgi:hypothetical protein
MKTILSSLLATVIFCTTAVASEPATLTATPPDWATQPTVPQAGATLPTMAPTSTDSIGPERAQDSATALPTKPLVQTGKPKDSQKDN